MTKLIGKVTLLRNTYRVVQNSRDDYKIKHKDSSGASYSQDVAAKVVEYVLRQFRGKTVTVKDARLLLQHAPKTLHVPYGYGYKLHFYAQSVLLVLVATGRASYVKCGRRFEYTILMAFKRLHRARRKLSAARRRTSR